MYRSISIKSLKLLDDRIDPKVKSKATRLELLLRSRLLIGLAPGADFQATAYPTQFLVVTALRSSQRHGRGAANSAALVSLRTFGFN